MEDKIIYESPDGGKTIYGRRAGQPEEQRWLVRQDPEITEKLRIMQRDREWSLLLDRAESDPALRELVERAQVYFRLTCENTNKDLV